MEKILQTYTIHVIWDNGCTDDITLSSNTLANMMLNSLLIMQEFNELSVYKDNDLENAIFYILNGKYTSNAIGAYWKIPL